MVVYVVIAGVDAAELANDVVLLAGVDVVRTDQSECFAEPPHCFLIARRSKYGMADALHAGGTRGETDHLARSLQRLDTRVNWLAHDLDRCHGLDAMHDLDRIAIRFGQADALAAARLIERLNA